MTRGDSTRLDALRSALRTFNTERDWSRYHGVKNLSMALASEVGELVALLRWKEPMDAERERLAGVEQERLEDEIGDIMLVLLNLEDRLCVDLVTLGARKLVKNARKYPVRLASRGPEAHDV